MIIVVWDDAGLGDGWVGRAAWLHRGVWGGLHGGAADGKEVHWAIQHHRGVVRVAVSLVVLHHAVTQAQTKLVSLGAGCSKVGDSKQRGVAERLQVDAETLDEETLRGVHQVIGHLIFGVVETPHKVERGIARVEAHKGANDVAGVLVVHFARECCAR